MLFAMNFEHKSTEAIWIISLNRGNLTQVLLADELIPRDRLSLASVL